MVVICLIVFVKRPLCVCFVEGMVEVKVELEEGVTRGIVGRIEDEKVERC